MHGLYAIIDTGSLTAAGLDVVRFAVAVLQARPGAVQLRHKQNTSDEHLRLLETLAPLCRDAGVLLFANDRADLALIAGCDGVHVGQHDLPPSAVRQLSAPRPRSAPLRIGMSVHNDEELAIALREAPDYVALGPVFDTSSKHDAEPTLGLAELARLAALVKSAGHPRVAIGGIDAERIAEVRPHVDMVAVISGLIDGNAVDPYRHATEMAMSMGAALVGGS